MNLRYQRFSELYPKGKMPEYLKFINDAKKAYYKKIEIEDLEIQIVNHCAFTEFILSFSNK